MYKVKMKGKTVENAIENALEVLKVSRDFVEIKVLSEGELGILGVFGGKDAEIEAAIKMDPAEKAKTMLQEILDKMGYIAQVYAGETTGDTIELEIKGDDIPRIIGKEGHNIDALQYIVSIAANKGAENRFRFVVDADGYRKKQQRRIEKIANELAEEVMISGKEIELHPMNAKERRIVHLTVEKISDLTSSSIGERNERRVVISPKKK
jgi:spoIIIJ-associated protein